jgi:phage-related tail protein
MGSEAICRSAQRGLEQAQGRVEGAETRLRLQKRKLQELRDQGAPAEAIEAQKRSVESAQDGLEGARAAVGDWERMVEDACAE